MKPAKNSSSNFCLRTGKWERRASSVLKHITCSQWERNHWHKTAKYSQAKRSKQFSSNLMEFQEMRQILTLNCLGVHLGTPWVESGEIGE